MRSAPYRLKTFAVGTGGSADLSAARRVAAHIGREHFEYAFTAKDVAAVLPHVIYHLESADMDLLRTALQELAGRSEPLDRAVEGALYAGILRRQYRNPEMIFAGAGSWTADRVRPGLSRIENGHSIGRAAAARRCVALRGSCPGQFPVWLPPSAKPPSLKEGLFHERTASRQRLLYRIAGKPGC